MYIGIHYIKKKWIAAINRFKNVVNKYEQTSFIDEALHRLVELHYNLGLTEESQKYASLLGYNYQSSEWYSKSYKIFNNNYKSKLEIKKEKEGIFKKFKKLYINKLIMSNSSPKNYKKKLELLEKYNKYYYQNQKPLVTDKKYDELKSEILELENKYGFNDLKSPSVKVGYKPSKKFEKFKHKVKMLSLSNAFNEEDLINFQKKNINFLALNKNYEFEYSAEPKIDGISASLNYKNGKLIKGLSRGDGEEGEDITENLKLLKIFR